MLKKTISLIAILVMLMTWGLSAHASIATAGTYLDEDFDPPEESAEGWIPEGWSIGPDNGNDTVGYGYVTEDGYVTLNQNGSSMGNVRVRNVLARSLPSDYTMMFDINIGEAAARGVYVSCVFGGYYVGTNALGHIGYIDEATGASKTFFAGEPEFGVWYTYAVQVNDGYATFYRKKRDEAEFKTLIQNVKLGKDSGKDNFRVYAYHATARDANVLVDNVRIFSGTYITEQTVAINEEKTKIEGTMSVACADIAIGESKTVIPVMAAYDKKGKILGMKMLSNTEIFCGDTVLDLSMDIDAEFYEKLKGGKVSMFLLTPEGGFRPQTTAYSFDVQ